MELDLSSLADFSKDVLKITPEIKEFCKNIYIFEWLDEHIFEEIVKASYITNFATWHVVMREWDKSNWKAYIIINWEAQVSIGDNPIAILWPWTIFWEYAIICEEDRSATVKAKSDLKCLVLDKNNLLLLANEDFKINNILASRVEKNFDNNVWWIFN